MTSSYGRHTIAAGVTDWSTDLAKFYAEDEEMRRRHGERLAANDARSLKIQKEESLVEVLKPIADFVPKAAKVLKMKERADQKAEQRKQWAFDQAYADLDVDSQRGVSGSSEHQLWAQMEDLTRKKARCFCGVEGSNPNPLKNAHNTKLSGVRGFKSEPS